MAVTIAGCSQDAVVGTGFEPPTSTSGDPTATTGSIATTGPDTTADPSVAEASMGSSGSSTGTSSGSATTGGACEVDADCYDDNACTYDFCGAGSCVNDAMDDVPSPEGQIDGDCRVVLCIDGNAEEVPQDSDLPDDLDVCTADICEMGEPEHPFHPAGTPCNDDGVCDGDGACTQCISPDDCDQLPPDDACQQRTCEAQTCGQIFADLGTELPLQTPGDCHVDVCDGAGGTSSEIDDADVPDDGLECTTDACDGGVASHTPLPSGTPCAAGVCNDAGGCVGCNTPADCGGMDTFCRTITCDDDTCGNDDTPAGVDLPAGSQVANDCQRLECDGDGNQVAVADDGDLPLDDGNDCTVAVCNAGVPDHEDLPIDTPCNDGAGVCDGAGTCVECNDASQCDAAPTCQVAVCFEGLCGLEPADLGTSCEDGLFCTTGDTCDGDGGCNGGGDPCVGPDGDSNCSESCDETANACTGDDALGAPCNDGLFCTAQDACDGAGTCDGGGSPCPDIGDGDGNCNEGCNEATDACNGPDPFGSSCNDGLFCTTADTCNGGGLCIGSGDPCVANLGDADNDCSESCNEAADSCTANDPFGSTCNDGAFCTVTDTCSGGLCVGSGNPCSALVGDGDSDCSESCNEASDACTANDPNGSSCNDGLWCNGADTCSGGTCNVHVGNPCSILVGDSDSDCSESCSEAADACTANDPNGSVCNDGLFCNGNDTCSGGVCSGHAGNPCSALVGDSDNDCSESCSEAGDACTANDPNGSVCNDGLFCNGTDTCSGGLCSGHAGNPCAGNVGDADDDCSESCSEAADNCTANDPANSNCADGLFCTSNDRCNNAGLCVGGANPCPGPDGDTDCTESCNENTNNCTADDPNGSDCDVSCFINGWCSDGTCFTVCP